MPIDGLQTFDIIATMEVFLEQIRPPEDLRSKVDINYVIDGRSVIINEVRPLWDKKCEYRENAVAKATYNISKRHWKIFWKRSDLRWHSYAPEPTVEWLSQFTELVKKDENHCFWG